RDALAARLKALYAIEVSTTPRVHGGRLFYAKRSGSQNQPVIYVRDAAAKGADRVAIDPNGLSASGTVAMDWMYPSPDGSLIAYGMSPGGSEHSTLRVRRVEAGTDLDESIPDAQFADVAWDPDGKGFLYTRHPAKGEVPAGEEVFHEQMFHHALGADPQKDPLLFGGEGRPIQENRSVYNSSDHQWTFFATSLDWAKNDLSVRRAGTTGAFVPVAQGLDGTTQGDAYKGTLYLRTNVGAERYRIVSVAPATPDAQHWKTVIPEQKGVIDDWAIVGGRIAVVVSLDAVSHLELFGLDGALQREVRLPALGNVQHLAGEPDGKGFLYTRHPAKGEVPA
ncbi:MAG TPA: hypothetical protein VLV15_01470, partial [Dongiaceae bacterium]|nr:hypothetical protein [Dongiaceae bacterium]